MKYLKLKTILFSALMFCLLSIGCKSKTSDADLQTAVSDKLKANAATANSLVGTIYVNDEVKATLTDADVDADGKTQVKVEYTLPK